MTWDIYVRVQKKFLLEEKIMSVINWQHWHWIIKSSSQMYVHIINKCLPLCMNRMEGKVLHFFYKNKDVICVSVYNVRPAATCVHVLEEILFVYM